VEEAVSALHNAFEAEIAHSHGAVRA